MPRITSSTETLPMAQPTNSVVPYRRRQQADAEIEQHDDAEMHGIDAKTLHDRQQDRRADQQQGGEIERRSQHQQHDVQPHQQHVFVARYGNEEFGHLRRHLHQGGDIAEA
jgi:hypothetical protein